MLIHTAHQVLTASRMGTSLTMPQRTHAFYIQSPRLQNAVLIPREPDFLILFKLLRTVSLVESADVSKARLWTKTICD